MRDSKLAFIVGAVLLSNEALAFAPTQPSRAAAAKIQIDRAISSTSLRLQSSTEDVGYALSSPINRQRKIQAQELRAATIDSFLDDIGERGDGSDAKVARALSLSEVQAIPTTPTSSFWDSSLWQVLSAASLVTGNTVGAGMLILPTLAAGPGFAISSALFLGCYLTVLTSGLVIADVAINQHESGYDVPSSFQELAEANLDNQWVARGVSAIPVTVNSLVMVFAFSKAGELGSSLLSSFADVDPAVASMGFVGLVGACLSTLSGENLSGVASFCVSALLVAFGGLLLPGLVAIKDPMGTVMAPGGAGDDWLASVAMAAPIVLTALQFQNIVPSLTKILKYDRTKTLGAIALGSFTPLAMYLAWCFAVMGGGIETSEVSSAGPLFTIFSASTLFGSSVGAAVSVTEEVETFLSPNQQFGEASTAPASDSDAFGVPAVLLSLAAPVAGVWAFCGCDASAALGVAGSYGAPVLYGVVPALMAWNQRRKAEENNVDIRPLVPSALVGVLGLSATVFVRAGLANQMTDFVSR